MTTIDRDLKKYQESKAEIDTYIARLKFAIERKSTRIRFQEDRLSDAGRNIRHTNRYTIAALFPNEDPLEAIRRELHNISVREYIETVKDLRYQKRSDMRVFGRKYDSDEVYIKFRVEVLPETHLFVMSFHFSTIHFEDVVFPYVLD